MDITNGNIQIILSTTSSNAVTFSWTVVQTGTVSGATAGTGNVINQTLTGSGTVKYRVTATEVATGCKGNPVDIDLVIKEQQGFKWVIDNDYSYCEQGSPTEKIFSALTTKSVTRTVGLGNSVVTLDNSNVLVNTLDGESIITLNTVGNNTIFTAQESGNFNIEVNFTGGASMTRNAGFFVEFSFFIEINGVKHALANTISSPITGNPCQFYLASPASSGTRTGSTDYNGNYLNTSVPLLTGQIVRLYAETFTSITGQSTAPLNMSLNNCKVYLSKASEDNTGYLIQPKLKKVTDDANELPLDVNNELCSESGLPQDTMDNPINDITYRVYNPTACPVDHTPDIFVYTPKIDADLSTNYDSNIVTITGVSGSVPISISDGEYRINGGSWTSGIGVINNNNTLQLRRISSSAYETEVLTTVTVGTYSTPFKITTKTEESVIECGVANTFNGGQSFPSETTITLGSGTGEVVLSFNAFGVPDKFIVEFDGVEVINTGYRGNTSEQAALNSALGSLGLPPETIVATGEGIASFTKSTATTTAVVKVFAPLDGTAWNYTLECPV